MKKLRVAVIYGGRSGEHEVSLNSAASIMKALDRSKYDVVPLLVPKEGPWPIDPATLARDADVVLPIIHGTGGEDGSLQGFLELAGLPYVGAGVLGSAVGMDKVLQKQILEQAGFPVTAYAYFRTVDWRNDAKHSAIISDIEKRLAYPCFVKPVNLGSSVGISKARNRKQLLDAIELALAYDRRCIVEQAVPEAREIECGALGNDAPRISVLGEIISSNEFYDYAAKYVDGKSRHVIPAELSDATTEQIRTMAARAFVTLDCAGFARIDFFVQGDNGQVIINEINTLPGFTSFSMFPMLWQASGIDYPELLDEMITLALKRHAEKRALLTDFAATLAGMQKAAKLQL